MKKITFVLLAFVCFFGLVGYIIHANTKYYAITVHGFNPEEQNEFENELNKLKKIGKVEALGVTSFFAIVSTFMPISIEEEVENNTNIEEMQEVTTYTKGEFVRRYTITLKKNNKNILRHLKQNVVMIINKKSVDENTIYVGVLLTEKQFKNLGKQPWVEGIEDASGIVAG